MIRCQARLGRRRCPKPGVVVIAYDGARLCVEHAALLDLRGSLPLTTRELRVRA